MAKKVESEVETGRIGIYYTKTTRGTPMSTVKVPLERRILIVVAR